MNKEELYLIDIFSEKITIMDKNNSYNGYFDFEKFII